MALPATPPPHHHRDLIFQWLDNQPKPLLGASASRSAPPSAIARQKRDRATIDQSPPPPKRRRRLQPINANIPLQSPIRKTRSQSQTKAVKNQEAGEQFVAVVERSRTQLRSPTKAAKTKGEFHENAGEQFKFAVAEKRAHIQSRSPAKPATIRRPREASAAAMNQLIECYSNEKVQLDEEYNNGDCEDGAMPTPRAGQSPDRRGRTRTAFPPWPRLTNIPILSSRSSESGYADADAASSIASATSSKRYKRDQSPTKTLADLKLLEKPVEYVSDEDTVRERVPEDVRKLWADIRRFCKGIGYIPKTLQYYFGEIEDEDELVYDIRSAEDLRFELRQMIAVKTQAHEIEGDSETQWYCSVHWPILTAAFRDQPTIEPKVVTHARPIKDFLPKIGKQYTESKLVDLAVNLIPPPSANIIQWLATQPPKYRTINQSLSGPLIQNPTVISIEVKTSQGTEVAAMVQVGIWISAWHERVQRLHQIRQSIITLPVIITSVHEWKLYFAVDRGDSIEMLRFPGEIGGTLSLSKLYRLLAVLRRLGKHAKDVYEPWFLEKFFYPSGVSR